MNYNRAVEQTKIENAFANAFLKLNQSNGWKKTFFDFSDIGNAYDYFEVYRGFNNYTLEICVSTKEKLINFNIISKYLSNDKYPYGQNVFRSDTFKFGIMPNTKGFTKYVYYQCLSINNFFEKFTEYCKR